MAADPTLNALVRKRAELAGELERHEATVRQLRLDLDSIDATIRLFSPTTDVAAIKPKRLRPEHAAGKGGIAHIVFNTLRSASQPLSSREIARHVMVEHGMNTNDKRMVEMMTARVASSLRHYRERGLLRSTKAAGQYVRWTIPGSN